MSKTTVNALAAGEGAIDAGNNADDEALMNKAAVRSSCGNVTDMCIWRWQRDPRVEFPMPDVVINGRGYWYPRTIRRWKAERSSKSAA